MNLRIRLFGVPSIECDGAIVSVAVRRHCVVLLAIIVLGDPDRRRSRRAVAAELWPDDDESTAVANLRRHLSFLSAAIPALDSCIGRDRDALWCVASQAPWCDVVAFERGELDLYRADFMEGFEHEWVVTQRERLRAMAISGFVARAETLREDGDEVAAIACARRAIEIDPLNESIAQLEIELHGERGDLASVDAVFASLKRRLHEIDAEPSDALAAVVENFHRLAREASARIPLPLTSYVETSALTKIEQLVRTHRLVTIVGPGGVGKTRLAIEAARRVASTFADGAYFVDLSAVVEAEALAGVLSRELGTPAALASKGFAGVQAFLRNRRALLVLDNCEQIAASCAFFLNEALAVAPHVHVIATSRESLGLGVERQYRLAPLALADATRLLFERARTAGWEGVGTPTFARLEAISKRLDGLPLALEIAASTLGSLSLADLERQLSGAFANLRSRDVTAPVRHRSLPDVIEWSVNLLAEKERHAFVRLSVFAGSFSAEAALAVCTSDLQTLAELVAKSVLVRVDAAEGRFVFLNSIGDYARRLCAVESFEPALRDAHAAFYADVAMQSEEPTFWKSEGAWLQNIDRDFANFTQALRWSLIDGGDVQHGVRLAIGLGLYFNRRGFFAEGATWIDGALERSAPGSTEFGLLSVAAARLAVLTRRFERGLEHIRSAREIFSAAQRDRDLARALIVEAALLSYLGRAPEAEGSMERALPLAVRSRDRKTEALVHSGIAYLCSLTDASAARRRYVIALNIFEEVGDAINIARTLGDIAEMDCRAGRLKAATENHERALAIARDHGERFLIARFLCSLGDTAILQGDYWRARECHAECLAICTARDGELLYEPALTACAAIAAERGCYELAARLLGASPRYENLPVGTQNQRIYELTCTAVEAALGVEEFALEMRFGSELPLRDAFKLAQTVFALPVRALRSVQRL